MITVLEYPREGEEAALQAHCSLWEYWSLEETKKSLLDPRYHLLVACDDGSESWVGSLLYWVGIEHGELLYIFTHPQHRNQGVARALFSHMEMQLQSLSSCKEICLEVRASNHAAQALYRTLHLKETRIRKKYYADGEDAVIFTKETRRQ